MSILDVIHKTIYEFLDEDEVMSDKDKLLLEVNKAICNNLKALEREPNVGHWIQGGITDECSRCGYLNMRNGTMQYKYCPECGAKMESDVHDFDNLDLMLEELWNATESEDKG